MPKAIELMEKRELEIGEMINYLSLKTQGFTKPKLILIGGYALRHYVPFSRYSRDCDFVLKEGLNLLRKIKPKDMSMEALEQEKGFGFMRWSKLIRVGKKKAKAGIDFMERQVRGRDGEALTIDDTFLKNSKRVQLNIGKRYDVFVPSYTDFFLLKILSARKSDIRDIAAMIWKNGLPPNLMKRAEEVSDSAIVNEKLRDRIIPEIRGRLFIHSFRGTFLVAEFDSKVQARVVRGLGELC